MKEKIKRILAVALLAATLFTLFTACNQKPAEPQKSEEGGEVTDAATEEIMAALELIKDGKSDYKIIYPENGSADLVTAVNKLRTALKNYTGADLKREGDYLPRGTEPDSNAPEILVGATNRPESQKVLQDLPYGDYVVRIEGKKLIILGGSGLGTLSAIDWFLTKYIREVSGLKYGTKNGTLVFTEQNQYLHTMNYFIKNITIAGEKITSDYRLMVPETGYVEKYIATLLQQHLDVYYGMHLEVVTDQNALEAKDILIGKTKYTTLTAQSGKYAVQVSGNRIQAVSDDVFGYVPLYQCMVNSVFVKTRSDIALQNGDDWSGNCETPDDLARASQDTIRVMYHNVWGYLNADQATEPNPVANRSDMALQIYEAYAPDVICFQEMSGQFCVNSVALIRWLLNSHYAELTFAESGGTGNPIYVNSDVLEILQSGYLKSRNGDKGTTWCILKRKSDGKIFGLTNSHFAANTNANGNATLGNQYRCQDAQCVVDAIGLMRNLYPDISVICGGDYNSVFGSDPINLLTKAGLQHARNLAKVSSEWNGYTAVNKYVANYNIYALDKPVEYNGKNCIDQIMVGGNVSAVTISRYAVCADRISCTTSDHNPHFADFTLE